MSPRKVRLVADIIRGLKTDQAIAQLEVANKAAARPVLKLLNSAIANAEHNFKLESNSLIVKTIYVDGGPVLKRSTPKAFGRATPIHKRTSHITIILEPIGLPKAAGAKAAVVKSEPAKKDLKSVEKPKSAKPATAKVAKAKAVKAEAKK